MTVRRAEAAPSQAITRFKLSFGICRCFFGVLRFLCVCRVITTFRLPQCW